MASARVAATWFVAGSILVTEPSPQLSVQTAPSPAARKRGCGPTGIVATTSFVRGSMRWTEPSDVPVAGAELVIHTASSPKAAQNELGETGIVAVTSLLSTSIRLKTPSAPLNTQTEPAPAARLNSPVASASPVVTTATTAPDSTSRRYTESSLQLATQSDPSATTIPPQGPGTGIVITGSGWSATSFSTRSSLVAQTARPSAARKSTYPGMVSRAIA